LGKEAAMTSFAIIGFGEVGGIFARDLYAMGVSSIAAYDIAEAACARALACGYVEVCGTAAEATARADVVFVAVTAGSALAAAASLSGGFGRMPFVVDVNSVSPATKRQAARIVEEAGGRYVEAAVMASVPPRGIRSPMLLGGPHVREFEALVAPLGLQLTVFSTRIGEASSVKMCRSVMIKGIEALTTECLLAAHHYGVAEEVLKSLSDTFPNQDWNRLARYMIGRSLKHGRRRAEEMREVAKTVEEAGVAPLLSGPAADRHEWAYDQGRRLDPAVRAADDLSALLAAITRVAREDSSVDETVGTGTGGTAGTAA
jgi:3-hydroxyisobutyrate dehydrogenase-like beta-hydroxyacid dehydrogenase